LSRRKKQKFIYANVFMILLLMVFILIFPGTVQSAPPGKVEVNFEFKPPQEDVESVRLAGSFNDWSTVKTPMEDENEDGVYEVTVDLKPGEYEYKFVVNGDEWITDPDNDNTVSDGFGGRNSVLEVKKETEGDEKKAEIGDGKIFKDSLWHDKDERNFLNKIAESKIALRFQSRKNDVSEVKVNYIDNNTNKEKSMGLYSSDEDYDYWRAEIEISDDVFDYRFAVYDQDTKVWYGDDGSGDDSWIDFEMKDQVVFNTPEWVKEAVFYQIFPDRFYNAEPDNDPELIETYRNETERYENIRPEWHQGIMPTTHHYLDPEKFTDQSSRIYPKSGWHVFYGGDLQGIEEKFDYLKKLGINAIYLNPIFEATANHRYNTANYENIDDNLAVKGDHDASNEYFQEFIKKAHDRDIKIVLDAVFNHGGYEHFAFQDVIEKGEDSEYSDWFFIESYPIKTLYEQREENVEPNYECWGGFGAHPKFNVDNPEVKEYFFDITRKWMDPDGDGDPSDGIDGWRLDVANEVKDTNPDFWQEWRKLVKDINPDAYITGEIWNNADDYLQGDEFDGVMNYRFRNSVINFVAKNDTSAEEFVNEINVNHIDYPLQAVYNLQNLIDSHDTERFMDTVSQDKDKLKLAALIQFAYPGAPMIYYGDEIGLDGGNDPDNRRTMIWEERPNGEKPDMDLYQYYAKLADIRKDEEVLTHGDISYYVPDDNRNVVIMIREKENEQIITFINAWDSGQEVEFEVDPHYNMAKDLLKDKDMEIKNGKINIELEPFSGTMVKPE
ncbi:MAG: alpha amylase N-terminal ig-like domain-containing protein, partial [Halanaerobiales bacterium]